MDYLLLENDFCGVLGVQKRELTKKKREDTTTTTITTTIHNGPEKKTLKL
jgi:hypothetical protein